MAGGFRAYRVSIHVPGPANSPNFQPVRKKGRTDESSPKILYTCLVFRVWCFGDFPVQKQRNCTSSRDLRKFLPFLANRCALSEGT